MSDPAGVDCSDSAARLKAIRAQRAAAKRQDGPFVKAMQAAMDEYRRMRADGVSREDAIKGLELVLRESWPHKPTKFPPQCDTCDDIGWEYRTCRLYARCERPRCSEKGDDWTHTYVVPCHCAKGDRFRPKVAAPASEEALAAVGRRHKRKPRGFARLG